MRRTLFVVAVTVITLAVCSNAAWAAPSADDAATPVSLRDAMEPFQWGLGWAALSLVVFVLITWVWPGGTKDYTDAPGTWSLPESWITTVTGASAALLALLGAGDSLAALFAEEKKQAVAELVVISALSALLVALGPMVAAILTFGDQTRWWSVVVAALFTLTGAMGLVVGVWTTFAGVQDPSPSLTASLGGRMVIGVELVVGAYAAVTLRAVMIAGPSAESIAMFGNQKVVRRRSYIL